MGRHAEKALFITFALVAALGFALTGDHFGDYRIEAGPSLLALAHGDFAGFSHASVTYAGSMTVRAPFVSLAGALGAGPMWIYRIGSIPCMLAGAVLAIAVFNEAARRGRAPHERWLAAGLVATIPYWLNIMYCGHPEEILVTALALGAILTAPGRPVLAGVLLGLAVAGKMWALIAVGPVLVSAGRIQARLLAAAALAGLAAYAPFLAGGLGQVLDLTKDSTHTANLWTPFHLFWPFADVHTVPISDGVGGTLRLTKVEPPALLAGLAHPLIVLVAAALSALAARSGRRGVLDALAVFALVAFLRCVLDPWNTAYYVLPCVAALATWEVLRRPGLPVYALMMLALTWVSFHRLTQMATRDLMWAGYVAWTLPMTWMLVREAVLGLPGRAKLLEREPVPVDALA